MIRKTLYEKKIMSILLAASMTVSLTACGGGNKEQDTPPAASQEPVQTEASSEVAAAPETEAPPAESEIAKYSVTGENENKELTMTRQPRLRIDFQHSCWSGMLRTMKT